MKVGLITSKPTLSYAQQLFVASLAANPAISLSIVHLNLGPSSTLQSDKKTGFDRLLVIGFKLQERIEKYVLKRLMRHEEWFQHKAVKDIKQVNHISAKGDIHGGSIRMTFDTDTIKLLDQSKFDILISLDGPIVLEKLSEFSRLGLLYTNCDKPSAKAISFVGFWSVFKKNPTTGFGIGLKSSIKGDDSVVFAGYRTTKDLCWKYNDHYLQKECYYFLQKLVLKLNAGYQLQDLDENLEETKWDLPKWNHFIAYQWLLFTTFIKKVTKHIKKTGDYWTVYFYRGSYSDIESNKLIKIENPTGGFFADPFVFSYQNRTIIFAEEYVIKDGKAIISALEIDDNDGYSYLGPVITEAFHLSYPFVFEYENELYMVPESCAENSIRLYKCKSFPLEWEYQYNLMSNIDAVDTTIVHRDNKYWLFTNTKEQDWEHNTILECFVAESPLSQDWRPHNHNPIVLNNGARNGGFLYNDKEGHMVFQTYDIDHYGKSLQIKRVKTLNENQFEAPVVKEIEPTLINGAEGLHHLSSNNRYTVFDTLKKQPLKANL